MAKRKLHKKELSFLMRVADLKPDGTLAKGRYYHIIRQTVTGHKIAFCLDAASSLQHGEAYYTVPYMVFLYDTLFPHICPFCEEAGLTDLTPISNTGVNSDVTREKP